LGFVPQTSALALRDLCLSSAEETIEVADKNAGKRVTRSTNSDEVPFEATITATALTPSNRSTVRGERFLNADEFSSDALGAAASEKASARKRTSSWVPEEEKEKKQKAMRQRRLLPPPPALYNLLVQPLALSRLVAPPLRSLMVINHLYSMHV